MLLTRGPHTTVLNSKALKLARITRTTHVPGGPVDDDTAVENMRRALEQFASQGVTSVNVAGVRPSGGLSAPVFWSLEPTRAVPTSPA